MANPVRFAGVIFAHTVTHTTSVALPPAEVLELGGPGGDRIGDLVRRSVPVLAFGSHVRAEALRAAREAGATAVPNSQVEARLRELLNE